MSMIWHSGSLRVYSWVVQQEASYSDTYNLAFSLELLWR